MDARKSLLPLLLALLLPAGFAEAGGGLLQRLPEDGTWVRYFVKVKDGAGTKPRNGTMTLKSVGRETIKGQKYRWIEIDMLLKRNDKQLHRALKVLIREQDLKEHARNGLTIARGWASIGRPESFPLGSLEKSPDGPLGLYFGCPMKNARTVKGEKTIDYQNGRLTIASAQSGELKIRFQEDPGVGDSPVTVTQTIWNHRSVPVGTAMAIIEARQDGAIAQKIVLTIQDFGKNAKSSLPEKK